MKIFEHSDVRLYSGYDGKLIAKNRKSLERFSSVHILSAYPKIEVNQNKDFTMPYIFVFGDAVDIDAIKFERRKG